MLDVDEVAGPTHSRSVFRRSLSEDLELKLATRKGSDCGASTKKSIKGIQETHICSFELEHSAPMRNRSRIDPSRTAPGPLSFLWEEGGGLVRHEFWISSFVEGEWP